MSFLTLKSHTKSLSNRTLKRKEQDSFLAYHFKHISNPNIERASSFASSKGSLTIEAALAAPIFFLAVVCLVFLLEMISVQTVVKSALHHTAKEMAKEAYLTPFILKNKMKQEIISVIGEERLDRSIIYGGSNGLECSNSRMYGKTAIMELSVQYHFKIPVLIFDIPVGTKEETVRVKGWTGYEKGGFGESDEKIVYVTEHGVVYHDDPECTYLDLSIQAVGNAEIEKIRNESGGKYYPCEFCMRKGSAANVVFITDFGNRYHKSLTCSGLKRTVYAVELKDVYGRGGCSKCVK